MNEIKLGYEMGTGNEVLIPLGHTMVTGVTNLTGKTTALEAMISRSKRRAVVFRTKIGEKSFLSGHKILPYYKDDQNWKTMITLVESVMPSKIGRQERYKIIGLLNQDTNNGLFEFAKKIDDKLEGKLSAFERDIFTGLQAYFKELVEKMQQIKFSKTLELSEGINIIDLEEFAEDEQLQSLIIKSVTEEVLNKWKNVTVVIPEAWKFIPQTKGSVCKAVVTSFVKQGATNGNYLWIDSQDITSVDKTPLKQVSVWIMGYQSEANEVKHALNQVPVPKSKRPTDDEIMSLNKGVFFFGSKDGVQKVYVQPIWLSDEFAIEIAKGKMQVSSVAAVGKDYEEKMLKGEKHPAIVQPKVESTKELIEKISDSKIAIGMSTEELEKRLENLVGSDVALMFKIIRGDLHNYKNENRLEFNELDNQIMDIFSRLKKLENDKSSVDIESIISQVISRLPTTNGTQIFQVKPLEKLTKDFLIEARDRMISEIKELSSEKKRMLKYLESRGKGIKTNELVESCFFLKPGGSSTRVKQMGLELVAFGFVRFDDRVGIFYGELKNEIRKRLELHQATEQELENLYDIIISELLV